MKLETFNPEKLPNMKTSIPLILMSSTSGTINFNVSACEKLGLKQDMQIQLLHDAENPGDWYLEIVKENGFLLREKKIPNPAIKSSVLTQSTKLVRKIFETVEYLGTSGHVTIATDPIKADKKTLWPLITAKLINKQ